MRATSRTDWIVELGWAISAVEAAGFLAEAHEGDTSPPPQVLTAIAAVLRLACARLREVSQGFDERAPPAGRR